MTVSYFEWAQDRAGYFWKESEVNERLADVMLEHYTAVVELAQLRNVPLRTAAYMLAIDRVVTSHAFTRSLRVGLRQRTVGG